MKKVLFVATVVKGHILKFHVPYFKWFKENGYEVFVVANNDFDNKEDCIIPYCDHYFDLTFTRNPLSLSNINAYKKLKKIIEENDFSIIHCHTPVGGVLGRLAARKCVNTKVIYTAHGFHFYKGASVINWLLYYPIEKFCSRFTDVLITINKEDYDIASKKFFQKEIYLVKGVGVSFATRSDQKTDVLEKLNITKDDFVLMSIGELNKNKNHKIVIDALKHEKLKDINNLKYVIAGEGTLYDYYVNYIKENNLQDKVFLLGFRKDIFDLLHNADLFVFPSFREGLPVSIMEAMHSSLACVASDIRGNRDLIINNKGGFICNNDINDYAESIYKLYNDPKLLKEFGEFNYQESKKYMIENVIKEYIEIYTN